MNPKPPPAVQENADPAHPMGQKSAQNTVRDGPLDAAHYAADRTTDGTAAPPAICSRASAVAALRWGFDFAIAQGARRITCVSPSFAEWPLDDAALLQDLVVWLKRPGRQLVLLAAGFDDVPRALPRFTAWRKPWVHALQTLQAPEEMANALPMLMFDDMAVSVRLQDLDAGLGRASLDRFERHRCLDQVDAILQRSSPAFAVNTLGL